MRILHLIKHDQVIYVTIDTSHYSLCIGFINDASSLRMSSKNYNLWISFSLCAGHVLYACMRWRGKAKARSPVTPPALLYLPTGQNEPLCMEKENIYMGWLVSLVYCASLRAFFLWTSFASSPLRNLLAISTFGAWSVCAKSLSPSSRTRISDSVVI